MNDFIARMRSEREHLYESQVDSIQRGALKLFIILGFVRFLYSIGSNSNNSCSVSVYIV